MKKFLVCALTIASVAVSGVSAFAVTNDVKDVYNGVTNSVGDLYTTGGMGNDHKTVIVSKIGDLADGDGINYLNNYTFDDETTTDAFGSNGSYEIVDGTVAGLSASDKIAYLTGGSGGSKDIANSYFAGASWGDSTTVTHATFQFDVYMTNTWNQLQVIPTAKNRYGIRFVAEESPNTLKVMEGGTGAANILDMATPSTYTRYEWHEYALEFNMPAGLATLYIDGNVVDTWTGLTTTDCVPADFNITGTSSSSGNIYMNNICFYEGGYIGETEEEVVYVDQSMSAYSTALELMFNNELEPGYYQVKMGTVGDTSYEKVNFVVGDFNVDPKDKLDVADARVAYGTDEGKTWYKQSFTKTVSNDEFSSYKSIKLISADGTRCIGAISFEDYLDSLNTHGYKWNRTKLTGSGDVTIALQIYAIPEDQDDFSLYFSTEEVKDAE